MRSARSVERVFALAVCSAAVLLFASEASAHLMTRPYDAPVVTNPRAATPELPPGYLEHEESGITFAYHPSAHERMRAAMRSVVQARKRMSEQLGREVLAHVEIRIAALPDELHTLGPVEDVPIHAPAIAFTKHKLVLATLSSSRSLVQTDLADALTHALAHVALDEVLDGKPAPLWLHEGYAAHVADDAADARAQMLVTATLQQRQYGISEIGSRFPVDAPETSLAYAQAADLIRFLSDKPRRGAFSAMLDRARAGEDFDQALSAAYGSNLAGIDRAWHRDMGRRYGFVPVFLSAIAIWLACAALIFLHRHVMHLRSRPEKPLRDERLTNPEAERVLAIEARAERAALRSVGESMGNAIVPEAEVPKVEHEGDWHTLH